ncbi:PAS domain-containing protein [Pontibacter sp. E15-1]|uniref:PAS domain-containing sensor histidine kinase n=1 Tax=Pontibacter sp. E15-1 TaxID=2919918 RepID=UPI001F4FEF69|nr:ATP-binding protein [Pontibacter sp. E15-1]MCJ8165359.1 PAS domain-containing protein [Pontibacter sp. E15-1]
MSDTVAFTIDAEDTFQPEALLHNILEVSLTGILLFKPVYDPKSGEITDLEYVLVNAAAQRMLQLPERPDKTFLQLYPNALEKGVFSFYRDTFLSGKPASHEVDYQFDGLNNFFKIAARRSGNGLAVSFTDTADHERSSVELALRESQERERAALAEADLQRHKFHRVIMEAPAMFCIFEGPDHVFKLVNPPYQQLVGDRPLLGKPIAEAMPELDGQPFYAHLDKVYRTGESFYAHEMLVPLDHDNSGGALGQNYYNFIYQATRNLKGEIDGILVFAYDVTTQITARKQVQQLNQQLEARVLERTKQLEAALQETENQREKLREQKSLLQRILGQVPASIATLTGPQHRYTFFNSSYQQLSGNRTKVGRTVAEVFPEVVEQGFVDLLDKVYTSGEPFIGVEMPAMLYDAATGKPEQQYVDFIYQPLMDERNQTLGILTFILDATEKVRARQQVQQLNEELTVANAALQSSITNLGTSNEQLIRTNVDLDNFIYTASHDLKAPILNIEGLMEALVDQLGPDTLQTEVMKRTMDLILGSVQRFKRTIEHLTEITKLQKENNSQVEPVSLETMLTDVKSDLVPVIKEVQAELDIDVSACPTISFSEKNLRSIVYNLLSNALKYHAPERSLLIQVRCYATASFQVFSVQDNGLGMDLTREHKLFKMFKRLHDHVEGTGIGLYMVKKIMENAGGKIEVESTVGEGSVFRVYFPHPSGQA